MPMMGFSCMFLVLVANCVVLLSGASCPGAFDVPGYGTVSLVTAGRHTNADIAVFDAHRVSPHMGAQAYFADTCTPGIYDHEQYVAINLLRKTLRYTVDLSGAGCGCNAEIYLTSMHQNMQPSKCSDYYCDAKAVCGVACTQISIQQANQHAWHSVLHTSTDFDGTGAGYGGGGAGWSGPRDWTAVEYGPQAKCINTSAPFKVAASFPVDTRGSLAALEIRLSQDGHSCSLFVRIGDYKGMGELSQALIAGMTPVISYSSKDELLWMDGKGHDAKGPCVKDDAAACSDSIKLYGFSIENIGVSEGMAPAAAFDCEPGHLGATLTWTESKKQWCCQHVGRACPAKESTETPGLGFGHSHVLAFAAVLTVVGFACAIASVDTTDLGGRVNSTCGPVPPVTLPHGFRQRTSSGRIAVGDALWSAGAESVAAVRRASTDAITAATVVLGPAATIVSAVVRRTNVYVRALASAIRQASVHVFTFATSSWQRIRRAHTNNRDGPVSFLDLTPSREGLTPLRSCRDLTPARGFTPFPCASPSARRLILAL